MRSTLRLLLFRVLPERPINVAHRHTRRRGHLRQFRPGLPELEGVAGRHVRRCRPQRPEVQNRIRVSVAEVKDHGRDGPADPLQRQEDVRAEPLLWRREGDARPRGRALPGCSRCAAGRLLPLRENLKVVLREVPGLGLGTARGREGRPPRDTSSERPTNGSRSS